MKHYYLLFFILSVLQTHAQDNMTYMFRLLLADKGQSGYTTDYPQAFLSQASIARRTRQGIPINETDLPIAPSYIQQIEATGVEIVAQSKWVQTVTVKTTDSLLVNDLRALPFVDTLYLVFRQMISMPVGQARPDTSWVITSPTIHTNIYGEGLSQIAIHNGNLLHENGYRGEGMTIAVIDGGFYNADRIDAINAAQILGTKNFSYTLVDPCRIGVNHGTQVLSCMLSNKSNVYVGTAPAAQYYLFVSEVDGPEFPVEEDFWISAIEYADSIGVDISTTSLGYATFDMPEMNHTQSQLDGQSILISRAARMAAEKGILVLNAAGNEGGLPWATICFPSDADKIITVGSVWSSSSLSYFTPIGPTADGRTKPDVMAMGSNTAIISGNGSLSRGSGTSFATPVMAGLVACLWQAFPDLTNLELIDLLQRVSHKFNEPDVHYGFGIPDFFKAFERNPTNISAGATGTDSLIRHIGSYLFINLDYNLLPTCRLSIYDVLGNKVEMIGSLPYASVDVSHLPVGLYIAHLDAPQIHQTCKFILR